MTSEELSLRIAEGEGLTVEFKEKYKKEIVHDFVAFSNSIGGILLLGIRDDGVITGEAIDNNKKAKITTLAQNCNPEIKVNIEQVDNVIVLTIPEGERKPYSCSQGYYKRLDAVTQKLKADEVDKFYQDHPRMSFEEQKDSSFQNADISLEKVNDFQKECNYDRVADENNTAEILSSLNLIKDDKFLNAGVLFFARQVGDFILHSQMTLLSFKGEDKLDIFDRMDVRDDLLTQFNTALFFVQKHLNKGSTIVGVNRIDEYEIPLEVLREAIVNAIVHRDYSITGTSIQIEIYSDRIEIVNPGGLPAGMDRNSLGKLSVRRNERIADLFNRMNKVERIGSGIPRMKSTLKDKNLNAPEFEINSAFRIIFYRPIYDVKLSNNERKIIRLIKEDNTISAKKISETLGLGVTTVENNLSKLKSKEIIDRVGSDKGGHWKILLS